MSSPVRRRRWRAALIALVVTTLAGAGAAIGVQQASAATVNTAAWYVFVNRNSGKAMDVYFARPVLQMVIGQAFSVAGVTGEFDVMCTVKGGGLSGQAGAVKHGISQALSLYEPSLRPALKAAGFLTRDSRVVERKKYGKRKARRSFQFSKR